jgi:TRAP-type mannitol/chloroaromatic compound transport system permease large subunit
VSIELITLLIIGTFILLLLAGLPLAWTMGATAAIFSLILFNPMVMLMVVSRVYNLMLNYTLVAVPLFIFMAAILQSSGVADQLFKAVYIWSGGLRGGMAIATIISCVLMAAMVGIIGRSSPSG